jgi:hypothetical protein
MLSFYEWYWRIRFFTQLLNLETANRFSVEIEKNAVISDF